MKRLPHIGKKVNKIADFFGFLACFFQKKFQMLSPLLDISKQAFGIIFITSKQMLVIAPQQLWFPFRAAHTKPSNHPQGMHVFGHRFRKRSPACVFGVYFLIGR